MNYMPIRLSEAQIREGLLAYLSMTAVGDGLIRSELPVLHSRIDVVRISSERLEGFEIKSDFDELSRLPSQAENYNQVFDGLTLVTGGRLAAEATCRTPRFWGILQARVTMDGKMVFVRHQDCRPNPRVTALGLASMLWRDEAAQCLSTLSAVEVRTSWDRRRLRKEIVEHVTMPALRPFVAKCLSNPDRFEQHERLH